MGEAQLWTKPFSSPRTCTPRLNEFVKSRIKLLHNNKTIWDQSVTIPTYTLLWLSSEPKGRRSARLGRGQDSAHFHNSGLPFRSQSSLYEDTMMPSAFSGCLCCFLRANHQNSLPTAPLRESHSISPYRAALLITGYICREIQGIMDRLFGFHSSGKTRNKESV